MADRLTPERRSWNMSRIRGKNTKPELLVRRLLHAKGYRYRLHGTTRGGRLPGNPDLVFTSRHKVIFVNGCFWHFHPVVVYQPAGQLTGTARSGEVPLGGGHDRSLHEDVPGPGKALGVAQPCFVGKLPHMAPDFGEIVDAGLPEGVPGPHLQQDIDERAGLEVVAGKPVGEDVENGQQLLLRGVAPAPGSGNYAVHGPLPVPAFQESQHELVLGREMPVEAR